MVAEGKSMPEFEFNLNPQGWGPTTLPDEFLGIPFSNFSKSEKIGRVADFVGKEYGKQNRRFGGDEESEDPSKFNLVDTSKARPVRNTFRGRYNRRKPIVPTRAEPVARQQLNGKHMKYLVQHTKRGKQWRRPKNTGKGNFRRNNRQIEASVKIATDWEMVEQFDMNVLMKMQVQPPKPEDLKTIGSLGRYNDSFDKLTARMSFKLDKQAYRGDVYPSPTTADDEELMDFARDYMGSSDDDSSKPAVFCTDELLAQIMVSPRSVFPWDVEFNKLNDKIILLNKREESKISNESVNETAPPLPEEEENEIADYNRQSYLSEEATKINQIFRQQALSYDAKSKPKTFSEENTLLESSDEEEEDPDVLAKRAARKKLHIAYRYRKYSLGSVQVFTRTELHAICKPAGSSKKLFANIYSFNEWDAKIGQSMEWGPKIDNQRGVLIATELKNNAFKIGKWTARSLLAGADTMRIGFVSRKSKTDPRNHVVVGVQQMDPIQLAAQINLDGKNMWGVFKAVADVVLKQNVGKYVLLKDPNRQSLKLFKLPEDVDVEGNETDSEEEEEEDEEGGDVVEGEEGQEEEEIYESD